MNNSNFRETITAIVTFKIVSLIVKMETIANGKEEKTITTFSVQCIVRSVIISHNG